MSKIYITRHGQTIWNTQEKYQGSKDSNLTQKGKDQAVEVGKLLVDKNIKLVYHSSLGRVLETVDFILSQVPDSNLIQRKTDHRLNECSYGDFEGMDETDVKNLLLEQGIDRSDPATKLTYQFPNGEDYDMVFDRVKDFLDEILPTNQDILIVAHNGSVRSLWAILNKIPRIKAMEYKPKNGELLSFEIL
jgi:probable phosphoglycerate mutase